MTWPSDFEPAQWALASEALLKVLPTLNPHMLGMAAHAFAPKQLLGPSRDAFNPRLLSTEEELQQGLCLHLVKRKFAEKISFTSLSTPPNAPAAGTDSHFSDIPKS